MNYDLFKAEKEQIDVGQFAWEVVMGFLVTGEVYVDIGDEQLDVLMVEAIALVIDYILNQEGSEYI